MSLDFSDFEYNVNKQVDIKEKMEVVKSVLSFVSVVFDDDDNPILKDNLSKKDEKDCLIKLRNYKFLMQYWMNYSAKIIFKN